MHVFHFPFLDIEGGIVVRRVWRLVHGWTGIFRRGRFCNILCEIYCNKGVISDHFLLHTPQIQLNMKECVYVVH